jgi:hypothetical protein
LNFFRLLNINFYKSAGPDQIHLRVSYELRNEIVSPRKLTFEQPITEKRLPNNWRSGNIELCIRKAVNLMQVTIDQLT